MKKSCVHMFAAVFAFGIALLVSGCSTTSRTSGTSAANSTEADGSRLWSQNCARCHNSRPSSDYSPAKWDVAMLHMRVRAGLTAAEHQTILEFLKSGN